MREVDRVQKLEVTEVFYLGNQVLMKEPVCACECVCVLYGIADHSFTHATRGKPIIRASLCTLSCNRAITFVSLTCIKQEQVKLGLGYNSLLRPHP